MNDCPACGKEMQAGASACPHCGTPYTVEKNPLYPMKTIVIGVGLVLLIVIIYILL